MDANEFLIELSESDRAQFGKVDFDEQSPEQQVFSAIWELDGQVKMGGFTGCFTSADGHLANFAPAALRRIGATKHAQLVARALARVSRSALPEDQEEREELVNALDARAKRELEALDQEYFACEDVAALLFAFVRAHPAVFGPVPAL